MWFDSPADGLSPQTWLTKTTQTGAKVAQIEVDWAGVEPNKPAPGVSPTSPSAPQFQFAGVDQRVEELVGAGIQPVFLITDAPRWAQGKGGSASQYATGGFKPNVPAFRDLAQAMAKRYSGRFPNPSVPGQSIPRVRYMQAWGEANTNFHLSPQWTRVGGRAINSGAIIYRNLLNAFYSGVKAGDPSTKVLVSGLEGYGDAPFSGLQRTHPVTFLENLLCLSSNLKRMRCSGGPAHYDILAADPYEVFSPTTHAVSSLDASAPDLGRLVKVSKAGLAAGTLLPRTPKPLWVTEFGYDSKPPNPQGVSAATQGKWLEEGFYVFWHEGARVAMWYLVRDQTPPYDLNYFSGVFFRNGKKKPSFTAYRFPFVIMPITGKTAAQAWGIAPVAGSVKVQVRTGGGWKTLRSLHAAAGGIFDFTSSALAHGYYRASIAGQSSLVWKY